jgi:hypothetical protein
MSEEITFLKCYRCLEEKPIESFYKKRNKRGCSFHCKPCELKIKRAYYEKNRLEIIRKSSDNQKRNAASRKQYLHEYHKKTKDESRVYKREYMRRRLSEDPEFYIMHLMRDRIRKALRKGYKKAASTATLIGCSISELRKHIESKFTTGMTWENQGVGGWEIDHIRPCASFNLMLNEDQVACFHFTNLQPLWRRDNLLKRDKWNG